MTGAKGDHPMLYEIDAGDLIDFARRWSGLGDAVSEQVSQVVDDPRAAAGLRRADLEVNPNAIELAKERIGGLKKPTVFAGFFTSAALRVRERPRVQAAGAGSWLLALRAVLRFISTRSAIGSTFRRSEPNRRPPDHRGVDRPRGGMYGETAQGPRWTAVRQLVSPPPLRGAGVL
jgi:hypothetical protein